MLSHRYYKQGELWGVAIAESGEGALARWSALGLGPALAPENFSDWMLKMWETPAIWLPGGPTAEEATRLFLEQRAVILLGTLDQMAFLKSNAAFRIGASIPDGDLSWFGNDFVVLAKGRNGELVREFLDYLYRSDVALTLFRAATTLPISKRQQDDSAWKKELESWPVIRAAMGRKLKALGLDKLAPQSREEVAMAVWESIEQVPEVSQRPTKAAELKTRLQKKLSSNSR
ncbi:MAG: hypothetical protein HY075_07520, partial [Deltaproteobacteria bacterium]|nr:hypothetical protein [Deltaproteobacteria bacterium]